jgi:alpha-galactosidase
MTSRRSFLEQSALSALGLALPLETRARPEPSSPTPGGFVDLRRPPDAVFAETASGPQTLAKSPNNRWISADITVTTDPTREALEINLESPSTPVRRIHLRWRGTIRGNPLILGDAWERGYGDLEWRGWVPDRVMSHYFVTHDGGLTHGYGVRTAPAALCFWQVDPQGISLWADVRSGSAPLELGSRTLEVCEVVSRPGRFGESAFAAVHALCRLLCPSPLLPPQPVYGSNDWYWAYGNNSAASVLADARHLVELSPDGSNRPFAVIDDGWQPGRGSDKAGGGTWDKGNDKFPDMPGLAAEVERAGAHPGVWIRPLQAPADAPAGWHLSREPRVLDPTVPDVLHKVSEDIARLRAWGYRLIKHDYTTFDIFGRWGFQMGSALTRDGWKFAEGSRRTTAEIISELYRTIRDAAGDALIIGCNTVSHLSAGVFELCRVGDDTSGTEWARTRKMGVNTLAFRGPQHGAFYVADADCVPVTRGVPWSLNRQWLDLVARSGTTLFVSLEPEALGGEQRRDLKLALALAAQPHPLAEPLDWQHTVYPARWRLMGRERRYDWVGADGAGG